MIKKSVLTGALAALILISAEAAEQKDVGELALSKEDMACSYDKRCPAHESLKEVRFLFSRAVFKLDVICVRSVSSPWARSELNSDLATFLLKTCPMEKMSEDNPEHLRQIEKGISEFMRKTPSLAGRARIMLEEEASKTGGLPTGTLETLTSKSSEMDSIMQDLSGAWNMFKAVRSSSVQKEKRKSEGGSTVNSSQPRN